MSMNSLCWSILCQLVLNVVFSSGLESNQPNLSALCWHVEVVLATLIRRSVCAWPSTRHTCTLQIAFSTMTSMCTHSPFHSCQEKSVARWTQIHGKHGSGALLNPLVVVVLWNSGEQSISRPFCPVLWRNSLTNLWNEREARRNEWENSLLVDVETQFVP